MLTQTALQHTPNTSHANTWALVHSVYISALSNKTAVIGKGLKEKGQCDREGIETMM